MADAASATLTALELFVGAGGLALGVARSGFSHSAVIDKDKVACETLRQNKLRSVNPSTGWTIIEGDVSSFDYHAYRGHVHLLSGGPPCQPFSQAGRRIGRRDKRDKFPDAIEAVRECQPAAFVFENVPGLLRASHMAYFQYIMHQLEFPEIVREAGEQWKSHRARLEKLYTSGEKVDLRYNVVSQRLQATDFGVPQRRERVFIVGVRADLGIRYSFPLPTHSKSALRRSQLGSDEYWERHTIPRRVRADLKEQLRALFAAPDDKEECGKNPWRTVRDAIGDLPPPSIGSGAPDVSGHFLNPGARSYQGHDGSLMDLPAKTLKAGKHGVPGGENTLRLKGEAVRYFTVRECARLQTFPDNWQFQGAWTRQMHQLGNAVPVDLAAAVTAPLAAALRSTSPTPGPA